MTFQQVFILFLWANDLVHIIYYYYHYYLLLHYKTKIQNKQKKLLRVFPAKLNSTWT